MTDLSRASAPALGAALIYQFERALLHLATAPLGSAVGIETLDDVAVKSTATGNFLVVEQDKYSTTDKGYALSDKSVAVWKTLANWLVIQAEPDRIINKFLFVSNGSSAGTLLQRLGAPEKNPAEILALTEAICAISVPSAPTEQSEAEKYIAEVQAHSRESIQNLVAKIILIGADGTGSIENLYTELTKALLVPNDIDTNFVIHKITGWLVHVIAEQWRTKVPAWVSRAAFVQELDSIRNFYRRKKRQLERARHLIPVTGGEIENEKSSPFVHHLVDIEASDEEVELAIGDYLRFSNEKFHLLSEGILTEGDFSDRDDHLEDRWTRIYIRHRRNRSFASSEDVGHEIYDETTDHLADLAGEQTVESYFTCGNYHRLVNDSRVWWHPKHGTPKSRGRP